MNFNLWERIRDWALLLVLLLLSAGAMLIQNTDLVRGARASVLETTAHVESWFAWLGRYVNALDENQRLREQNILLSSEVARSRESIVENDRLLEMLELTDSTETPLLAVRIIAKDINPRNFFLIDAGTNEGVEQGMAIVDARGILGKVVLASAHYAKVMSYLNTDFRLPAKVQPVQSDGIVSWEGDRTDRLLMQHVAKTEPVTRGMRVVTSGYSATFPSGYAIGTVDSVSVLPGRSELQIHIAPSAPLSSADHAFVILSRPDPERIALDAAPFK